MVGVLVAVAGRVRSGRRLRYPSRPWGPPSGVAYFGTPGVGDRGPPKARGLAPSREQVRGGNSVLAMPIREPAVYVVSVGGTRGPNDIREGIPWTI